MHSPVCFHSDPTRVGQSSPPTPAEELCTPMGSIRGEGTEGEGSKVWPGQSGTVKTQTMYSVYSTGPSLTVGTLFKCRSCTAFSLRNYLLPCYDAQ